MLQRLPLLLSGARIDLQDTAIALTGGEAPSSPSHPTAKVWSAGTRRGAPRLEAAMSSDGGQRVQDRRSALPLPRLPPPLLTSPALPLLLCIRQGPAKRGRSTALEITLTVRTGSKAADGSLCCGFMGPKSSSSWHCPHLRRRRRSRSRERRRTSSRSRSRGRPERGHSRSKERRERRSRSRERQRYRSRSHERRHGGGAPRRSDQSPSRWQHGEAGRRAFLQRSPAQLLLFDLCTFCFSCLLAAGDSQP